MSIPIHSHSIRTEQDVVSARSHAREIAGLLGFDNNDRTRIATAVSEIARNAFHYGKGGKAEFSVDPDTRTFVITISDAGPGISGLKDILSGAYRSKTGMGLGILGARRLMDEFSIQSQPGGGVTVRLAKSLLGNSARVTKQRVSEIARKLSNVPTGDLLDELRHENQELIRVMEELRVRQEELLRLNTELEDTNRGVVALYAELDEKAERLRRADQMKTRFLSHMSHEFRTPLTSIMALARLLTDESDGKLNPEQQKQVGFIRKSADNLLEMVNDLLDLSRVEAGRAVVRPTEFPVASLFGALRGVLRPLRVRESVDLIFEDPVGVPPLYTDESKVSQILRNFISNALKFTERGEVRVSAMLTAQGSAALFAVADTGIGIAPENLDFIFEEFAQVDSVMQARFKGTGLGLALAKGLAEVLGGRVWVESELGRGSTFFAEIPLVYAGAELAPVEHVEHCDFLLIDDEDVSRYLIRQCLGASATYLEASDGPEGISMAKRQQPGAIILDLNMPGLNGTETLRELRADPATRQIPIIILTAKSLTAQEMATLNQAATAVFSKEVLSLPDAGSRIRSVIAVAKAEAIKISASTSSATQAGADVFTN